MNIQGARFLVTGAGRGLGRQVAVDLAERGGNVLAADINEDALTDLQDQPNVRVHAADVSDELSVRELVGVAASEWGGLDGLVNNAGITRDGLLIKLKDGELHTLSLEDFRRVLDVNLVGVFLCGREAAGLMAQGGGGVIVNISSISRTGNFGQTNYSAAKAGVDAMTVTWSKELARYDIRCAAVAPGFVDTEMVQAIPERARSAITDQVPLKRLGTPAEIAETVRFIVENDFVNGKIFEVDGGLRL